MAWGTMGLELMMMRDSGVPFDVAWDTLLSACSYEAQQELQAARSIWQWEYEHPKIAVIDA